MKPTYKPITEEEILNPPVGKKILDACDDSVKRRRGIEIAIVTRLLTALQEAGFEVLADNGEEEVKEAELSEMLDTLFACDESHILAAKNGNRSAVFLVFGNDGWDVVTDYSLGLDDVLSPFGEWVSSQQEEVGRDGL